MKSNRRSLLVVSVFVLVGAAVFFVAKKMASTPTPIAEQQTRSVMSQSSKPVFSTGADLAILERGTVRDLGTYELSGTEKNPSRVSEVLFIDENLYVLEQFWRAGSDGFIVSKMNPATKEQTVLATGSGSINGAGNAVYPAQPVEKGMFHRDQTLFLVVAGRSLLTVNLATGKATTTRTWEPKGKESYQVALQEVETNRGQKLLLKEEYRAEDGMYPDSERYSAYDDGRNAFVPVTYASLQVQDPFVPDPVALECTSPNDPVCTKITLTANGKTQTLVDPYTGPSYLPYTYYDAASNIAYYAEIKNGIGRFMRHDVSTKEATQMFTFDQSDVLLSSTSANTLLHITGSGVTVYSLPAMREIASFVSPDAAQFTEPHRLFQVPSEGYFSGVRQEPLRRFTVYDDGIDVKVLEKYKDYKILDVLDDDEFLIVKQWSVR